MTTLAMTYAKLVAPFAALINRMRDVLNNDPVPCWTEYLREENKKR